MKYFVLISILILSGCTSTPKVISDSDITSTMNLIALTEEAAPAGIKGVFKLSIKAAGIQNSGIYLNTELDYRDRRNVSVAIHPRTVNAFIKKYGTSPDLYFINKTVEVTGEAKRMIIDFYAMGKKTEKYYFQTHINITSLDQIKVLD